MDITERRQAEEGLKLQGSCLQQLFDNSPDAIVMLDTDYKVVEANLAFEMLFGYSNQEIRGRMINEFIIPKELEEKAFKLLGDFFDRDVIRMETQIKRKDGSMVDVSVVGYPIRFNGNMGGFYVIYSDITERKQAEEELTLQKSYFRQLFDNSPDAIAMLVESDTGFRFAEVNKAFEMLFGYSSQEVKGQLPTESIVPKENVEEAEESLRSTLNRGVRRKEVKRKRKDGRMVDVSVVGYHIHFGGKLVGLYATFTDITERKQAEETIKRSTELLKEAQTLGRIGSWEYDIEKGAIIWSDETYALLERDVKLGPPSLGEESSDDPPLRAKVLWDDINKAIETGQTFSYDRDMMLPSGKRACFHVVIQSIRNTQGRIVKIHGTIQDITERKQAEETLRASEEKQRLIFESVTDGIIVTDKDLKLVEINEAGLRMTGYRGKAEIIGRNGLEFIPERDRTRLLESVQTFGELEYIKNVEYMLLRKDGSEFPAELSATVLKDGLGNPAGYVTIAKDITERKEMQEQLMLSDRLASVGELASGIAHELNNPLTSVIGFSQLLLEKDVAGDIKEDLSFINSEAQRAARTVRNLLTFARKHAPLKELNQINNIIEDVLKLRDYEQKVNNIEVERRFASNLPEITVDHFQMQQVFLNIIINAEYFMAKSHNRGRLTITTEKLDDMVRISFTDDGPGIPRENLSRLFAPFFTTKPVGRGTGLGLSICYGIVAEHGGKIYAKSEPGKGATFVVELPLKVAEEVGYGKGPTLAAKVL